MTFARVCVGVRSRLRGMRPKSSHMFHLLRQKEEVHELGLENSRLASLLCKLKAASRWKQLVEQGKLHRQLLQAQQVGTKETAHLHMQESARHKENLHRGAVNLKTSLIPSRGRSPVASRPSE